MKKPAIVMLVLVALVAGTSPLPAPPKPVKLVTVPEFCEGVVFDRDGNGYTSHGKFVTRFTLDGNQEIWAETGGANGHKILADGTHLLCDRSHRAVLRLDADGKILGPAAKEFDGKPLRGPNDLSLDVKNGGFYFTDPEHSDLTNRIGGVYYCDKADGTGTVRLVDKGLAYPNGVVLTSDGKRLFVAETLTNQVHVYDVVAPGKVGSRKRFADLPKMDKAQGHIDGLPDGMCLDAEGNLYVAHFGMGRVEVLDKNGKWLRAIPSGNITSSNVAFGGPNHDQLFVTGGLGPIGKAEGAVFRVDLGVKGLKVLPD